MNWMALTLNPYKVGGCRCSHVKNRTFHIHFWVSKAPLNSFQGHFLSNGTSKEVKTILTTQNLEGQLLKKASS